MTTKVAKNPQSDLIEFCHNYTHKLGNWGKSTEVPVDHHVLYFLCTKIISKMKIYETIGFDDTVY